MIGAPLGWDLIAAKRPTETRLPTTAVLRYVIAVAPIQVKSDWTGIPEGRNRQDAFQLACLSHRLDPILPTGSIVRRLDKRLLRVWDWIDITDMTVDPLGWDLTAGKRLTEPYLPAPAILRHV